LIWSSIDFQIAIVKAYPAFYIPQPYARSGFIQRGTNAIIDDAEMDACILYFDGYGKSSGFCIFKGIVYLFLDNAVQSQLQRAGL
jgi:hypothetical protein